MFLYMLVEDIKNNLKLFNTLMFLNEIFWFANNLSAIAEHYQNTSHKPGFGQHQGSL